MSDGSIDDAVRAQEDRVRKYLADRLGARRLTTSSNRAGRFGRQLAGLGPLKMRST